MKRGFGLEGLPLKHRTDSKDFTVFIGFQIQAAATCFDVYPIHCESGLILSEFTGWVFLMPKKQPILSGCGISHHVVAKKRRG